MKTKTIFFCSLVLASSTAFAQQSLLNAGQAATSAPSMTDQIQNTAEQKLLQAAPAPIQQGVQKFQQAQQLQNAVGAVSGAPASVSAVNPAAPSASSTGAATTAGSTANPGSAAAASPANTVTDTIEGAVKQKAASGAMNLFK